MKLAIFGLTMSSSWGNGHATLWRGLCKALGRMGHQVVFFEHNQRYYESARDAEAVPGAELVIYEDWSSVRSLAARTLSDADAAIVTSYCPDAIEARDAILDADALAVFYDLDTGVTLANTEAGVEVPYLGRDLLRAYDLVLSYTGGEALRELATTLGARSVAPLYGHVDPCVHRHVEPLARMRADLSYLGTYATDRQQILEDLFIAPSRLRPRLRFLMAGAQYPDTFSWSENLFFLRHLPSSEHAAFFSSSRLTLNVTREPMARRGWCPSGRLFEAAACRTAILSDDWPGLASFYTPGEEILLARSTAEALAALEMSDAQLERIAARAYERTLAEHTSDHRARELVDLLDTAMNRHRAVVHAPAPPLASVERS
jgi:spore maturation protein CgeB